LFRDVYGQRHLPVGGHTDTGAPVDRSDIRHATDVAGIGGFPGPHARLGDIYRAVGVLR
jgi:hypothetical protein